MHTAEQDSIAGAFDDLCPDIHTATEEYAQRFSDQVGGWMLHVQAQAVLHMLRETAAKTILDVGGGHAQLAPLLCAAGYQVTVLGSSEECAARLRPQIASGQCSFALGRMQEIPYPDQTFDAVVCVRQINHLKNWRRLVSELCRVSRAAVIIDYPSTRSFNILNGITFRLKKKLEGNTRPFLVFNDDEMRAAFAAQKFNKAGSIRQFFLPVGLYRAAGSALLAQACERIFSALGLTKIYGSPVILALRRG